MKSMPLFAGAEQDHLILEPFPHVILQNKLGYENSLLLLKEVPHLSSFVSKSDLLTGSNVRANIPFHLLDKEACPQWHKLATSCLTKDFFFHVAKLLLGNLHVDANSIQNRILKKEVSVGIRGIHTFKTAEVLLDAQLSINTTSDYDAPSVRQCHVDNARKIYSGLYYFRDEKDDSTGGDLEIYKFTDENRRVFVGDAVVTNNFVRQKKLEYQNDIGVFFLNSLESLHGVTPRSKSSFQRVFLNIIAEVERPLFDMSAMQV